MLNLKKSAVILVIMFAQTLLAISAGFMALHFSAEDSVSSEVLVEGTDISGLSREKAREKLEEHYKKVVSEGFIRIVFNGGEKFDIAYTDINLSVDCEATVALAFGGGDGGLQGFIGRYFYRFRKDIPPVVRLNESKLKEKLDELAIRVNREPVNADLQLKEGRLIKNSDVDGIRLNTVRLAERILDGLRKSTHVLIELKQDDSYLLEKVKADIVLADLEGADEIISSYTTRVPAGGTINDVRSAAKSINKVLLRPSDEFSFKRYLEDEGLSPEEDNKGYCQVASNLYAAVLTAGIDYGTISRVQHAIPEDYIAPGLDVHISETYDFKFTNTLKQRMVIFAQLEGDSLEVSIAGRKEAAGVEKVLETDIVQKFIPPVIYVESKDLEPGEKKLVSSGKEGLKVEVYRTTSKDGVITDKELLSTDTYQAVKAVMHIGPHTEWQDETDK